MPLPLQSWTVLAHSGGIGWNHLGCIHWSLHGWWCKHVHVTRLRHPSVCQVEQCTGGFARFTFGELCNRTLGAADYIAVAQAFHTVFLTDIPTMSLKVIAVSACI